MKSAAYRAFCLVGQMLAVFLLLPLSSVAADDLLAQLKRHNSELISLEGRFRQEKSIDALPLPLASHGQFSFDRDVGVTWELLEPVADTLRITTDGLRWEGRSDSAAATAPSAVIARIFLAVIGGELGALDHYFLVEGEGDLDAWALTLTPRAPSLASYIESIEIRGAVLAELLLIREANGDRTRIELIADRVARETP